MQQRLNSERSPPVVIGQPIDEAVRFESRHECRLRGGNGRLQRITVKLAPRVVQLAPQLRNPTATDLEPLGRFGRPFATGERLRDLPVTAGERF